jgi:hypothetical protein
MDDSAARAGGPEHCRSLGLTSGVHAPLGA